MCQGWRSIGRQTHQAASCGCSQQGGGLNLHLGAQRQALQRRGRDRGAECGWPEGVGSLSACTPCPSMARYPQPNPNVAQPATPTTANTHLDGKGGTGGRVLREVLREMRGVGKQERQLVGGAKRYSWVAQYMAAHAGSWAPGPRCKGGGSNRWQQPGPTTNA